MGNKPTIRYSFPCSEKQEGETAIHRNLQAQNGVIARPSDHVHTMQDAWLNSVKTNSMMECLFTRNPVTQVYEAKTY